MKRIVFALLWCTTVAGVAPVAGQTRSEPQMFLSIFAGLAGGTDLWSVGRQPLLVLTTQNLVTPVYDTLRLSRRISSGFVAGVTAAYFPSPYIGWGGEISLLGLGLDDQCSMVAEDVADDFNRINNQICTDLNTRAGTASTVAFYAGMLARLNPRGAVVPYLRLQGGITSRQSAITEVTGRFTDPATGAPTLRDVYVNPGGGHVDPSAALGVGLMVPVSPGYQFRLELRDVLLHVQEVTGPSTLMNPGRPPLASRWVHNPALIVHVDIVLERKRGRRY